MYLNKEEEKMYQGEYGTTVAKSMEILVALGDIYEAPSLIDISSAQISGVSYKTIGGAGLEYLEDLSKNGANLVNIPSTLNPAGIDLDNWKTLNFPKKFSEKQKRIVEAYGKLGVSKTCTCTPYLIGNVPRLGDHVAWSESSAVAYLNSVIGGRTNREGGPSALASAICGKTAMYGYHETQNRIANTIFDLDIKISGLDYGTVGYIVGKEIGDGVPYFNLKNKSKNTELKSLGAALASSGAVALYHIENETPEYELAKNDKDFKTLEKITISKEDILTTKENLSTTNEEADLVCLGCPHASLEEIKEIAMFVKGKAIKNQLWVCTSINIKSSADRMGYTKIIENSGGHIPTDTCMVVAPIEDMGYKNIGVNSAKAANYVPSMCGLNVIYDDFKKLIKFK
ncbi:MAG: aconitase X catalytic domain-containing protein [Methanobrevibacter sp.]|jgi:predicted aconitase|nr:aconitase X catalytic domain-containing protein [Candidatus Methanovirga australis]